MQVALWHLEHNSNHSNHEYWSTDIDLNQIEPSLKSRILGPNQITDLQLLLLAHRHHGQLVTLDKGIAELARGTRYANSLLTL